MPVRGLRTRCAVAEFENTYPPLGHSGVFLCLLVERAYVLLGYLFPSALSGQQVERYYRCNVLSVGRGLYGLGLSACVTVG